MVLLHGCCHNPAAQISPLQQWAVIADMAERQGFTPFIDFAYQGLGDGLDRDAAGMRLMVARLPEVIIAASCSKNMGLYRERVGIVLFVCRDETNAQALVSQGLVVGRRIIPCRLLTAPAGRRMLSNPALEASWRDELAAMCQRINGLRSLPAAAGTKWQGTLVLSSRGKRHVFFPGPQRGTGAAAAQDCSIYMLDSSRINVAGSTTTISITWPHRWRRSVVPL